MMDYRSAPIYYHRAGGRRRVREGPLGGRRVLVSCVWALVLVARGCPLVLVLCVCVCVFLFGGLGLVVLLCGCLACVSLVSGLRFGGCVSCWALSLGACAGLCLLGWVLPPALAWSVLLVLALVGGVVRAVFGGAAFAGALAPLLVCVCLAFFPVFASVCCLRSVVLGALLVVVVVVRGCYALVPG